MKRLLKKQDYDNFVNNLGLDLTNSFPNDACFYVYGSYAENRCVYGRSDIDGGIILDSGIITPKDKVMRIAEIVSTHLSKSHIKLHLNLTERETNKDGRFLSYSRDFTDYFKQDGHIKIISGSNFVFEMNGLDFKLGVIESVGYNLRRIRNGLLHSIYDIKNDEKRFKANVIKSFEILANTPKKLIYAQFSKDIFSIKLKALEEFREYFPDLNLEQLEKVNFMLENPKLFFNGLENVANSLSFYKENITCLEYLLKAYIEKFPKISGKEARSI